MTQEHPGRLGPGRCDAEVSGLVARGPAPVGIDTIQDELAELRCRVADLQGQVVALQAEVFRPKAIVSPGASNEATEALQKKRAEAEQRDRETEVSVDAEEWERGWLRS